MRTAWCVMQALFLGCGGGGDGSFSPTLDAMDAPPGAELAGTWTFSACGNSKLKRVLTATTTEFLYRTEWYPGTDSSCSQPHAVITVSERYQVGAPAITASGAREIDTITKGTTLTPTTAQLVAQYNQEGWCGYFDWALNVAKDVTGRTCGIGSDAFTFHSSNHIFYGIYLVDQGRLYFGSPASGTGDSDGTRPTQIDQGFYLTKQ